MCAIDERGYTPLHLFLRAPRHADHDERLRRWIDAVLPRLATAHLDELVTQLDAAGKSIVDLLRLGLYLDPFGAITRREPDALRRAVAFIHGALERHAPRHRESLVQSLTVLDDSIGWTLVHAAVAVSNLPALRYLREHYREWRSQLRKRDWRGYTPCMLAAASGDSSALQVLSLDLVGTNNNNDNELINARSHTGHTALTLALQHGHFEFAHKLLQLFPAIDVSVRTNTDEDALSLACHCAITPPMQQEQVQEQQQPVADEQQLSAFQWYTAVTPPCATVEPSDHSDYRTLVVQAILSHSASSRASATYQAPPQQQQPPRPTTATAFTPSTATARAIRAREKLQRDARAFSACRLPRPPPESPLLGAIRNGAVAVCHVLLQAGLSPVSYESDARANSSLQVAYRTRTHSLVIELLELLLGTLSTADAVELLAYRDKQLHQSVITMAAAAGDQPTLERVLLPRLASSPDALSRTIGPDEILAAVCSGSMPTLQLLMREFVSRMPRSAAVTVIREALRLLCLKQPFDTQLAGVAELARTLAHLDPVSSPPDASASPSIATNSFLSMLLECACRSPPRVELVKLLTSDSIAWLDQYQLEAHAEETPSYWHELFSRAPCVDEAAGASLRRARSVRAIEETAHALARFERVLPCSGDELALIARLGYYRIRDTLLVRFGASVAPPLDRALWSTLLKSACAHGDASFVCRHWARVPQDNDVLASAMLSIAHRRAHDYVVAALVLCNACRESSSWHTSSQQRGCHSVVCSMAPADAVGSRLLQFVADVHRVREVHLLLRHWTQKRQSSPAQPLLEFACEAGAFDVVELMLDTAAPGVLHDRSKTLLSLLRARWPMPLAPVALVRRVARSCISIPEESTLLAAQSGNLEAVKLLHAEFRVPVWQRARNVVYEIFAQLPHECDHPDVRRHMELQRDANAMQTVQRLCEMIEYYTACLQAKLEQCALPDVRRDLLGAALWVQPPCYPHCQPDACSLLHAILHVCGRQLHHAANVEALERSLVALVTVDRERVPSWLEIALATRYGWWRLLAALSDRCSEQHSPPLDGISGCDIGTLHSMAACRQHASLERILSSMLVAQDGGRSALSSAPQPLRSLLQDQAPGLYKRACNRRDIPTCVVLLRFGLPLGTAPLYAARCGNLEALQLMLDARAQEIALVHPLTGKRLVHEAAIGGNEKCLALAISRVGTSECRAFDQQGRTPLMAACSNPRALECVRSLLPYSDVRTTDAVGNTALSHACIAGAYATVQLLLEHRADVNHANEQGLRPFDLAAMFGHLSLCEYLHDREAQRKPPCKRVFRTTKTNQAPPASWWLEHELTGLLRAALDGARMPLATDEIAVVSTNAQRVIGAEVHQVLASQPIALAHALCRFAALQPRMCESLIDGTIRSNNERLVCDALASGVRECLLTYQSLCTAGSCRARHSFRAILAAIQHQLPLESAPDAWQEWWQRHQTTERTNTPLHYAMQLGWSELVLAILKPMSKAAREQALNVPNGHDETPLLLGWANGGRAIRAIFWRHVERASGTSLAHVAAGSGLRGVLENLWHLCNTAAVRDGVATLKQPDPLQEKLFGPDANQRTLLDYALDGGSLSCIVWVRQRFPSMPYHRECHQLPKPITRLLRSAPYTTLPVDESDACQPRLLCFSWH